MNIDNARHKKWKEIIEEQEKSGLTQEAFCKAHNIKPATLVYYRSVFRKKKPSADPIGQFAKVSLAKPQSVNEIRLLLPNGFQCVIPIDIELVRIKELVRVFLSC